MVKVFAICVTWGLYQNRRGSFVQPRRFLLLLSSSKIISPKPTWGFIIDNSLILHKKGSMLIAGSLINFNLKLIYIFMMNGLTWIICSGFSSGEQTLAVFNFSIFLSISSFSLRKESFNISI